MALWGSLTSSNAPALRALRPCDLKSNAHAHVCASVLDGVKNVTNGRTDGRTDKAFLGVGYGLKHHLVEMRGDVRICRRDDD